MPLVSAENNLPCSKSLQKYTSHSCSKQNLKRFSEFTSFSKRKFSRFAPATFEYHNYRKNAHLEREYQQKMKNIAFNKPGCGALPMSMKVSRIFRF